MWTFFIIYTVSFFTSIFIWTDISLQFRNKCLVYKVFLLSKIWRKSKPHQDNPHLLYIPQFPILQLYKIHPHNQSQVHSHYVCYISSKWYKFDQSICDQVDNDHQSDKIVKCIYLWCILQLFSRFLCTVDDFHIQGFSLSYIHHIDVHWHFSKYKSKFWT